VSDLAELLAHPDIERIARRLMARPGRIVVPDTPARLAAVALVLRTAGEGALELLMIHRAERAGDPWSGHIALPGGRHEPADRDLRDTAVRETLEETGIDLDAAGRILGTLDDLHPRTPVLPPIVVRPYVGIVAPDVPILPSDEVASAFWVPLAELREPARWVDTVVPVRGAPLTVTAFRHGEHVVWGMTERLLRQFISILEG
jgi:8-oxo-dGTP pyrophosphatase MutT (NUDIX family)